MSDAHRPAISLLIIDDNPGSLELLSSALAQPGLEILTASDPEEGLDLVRRRHPQIVLTDLVMPRLSGLEVLERIVEFDPSIDVILMTAHYSTESAVEAIKKGATDYLNKPISIATLRERMGRLVDEARRRHTRCAWRTSCWPAPSSRALSAAARSCGICSRASVGWRRITGPCWSRGRRERERI